MEKQTNKEELLKAVADVLDEALAEYEKLAKWEGDMQHDIKKLIAYSAYKLP